MPRLSHKSRLINEAKKLDEHGYAVIPMSSKKPLWKEWQKNRRPVSEVIEAIKTGNADQIGIVLNLSKMMDIEYDSTEGKENFEKMFGGEIPITPTYKSKRGNHYFFRRPNGLPEKAKVEIDDIEFHIGNGKASNSIVPPSHHSDDVYYEWEKGLSIYEIEPAELPEEIADLLRQPTKKKKVESNSEEIPEGKRNDTLFSMGCSLKSMGLDEEKIASTLLDINSGRCVPPLTEEEVKSIAHSVATGERKPNIGFVDRLLDDMELWHDDNSEPFATLTQGDHRENWKIGKRSLAFRRWISKRFYEVTGEMIKASDLADLCALLEGRAVFDGPEYQLCHRVGEHDGKIYIDLCDDKWRAIEIDDKGWRIVSDPPVKFRRAKAMLPLPIPVKTSGKKLKELLYPFLNIREEQWPLIGCWLPAALRPRGPYPVVKFLGEQGSGKTVQARVLRSLIDPNSAPVRAEPRTVRDLMITANNGWLICLDNLSFIKADLSDALCRLATGGGFAIRTLYTDDDETIFDASRPSILTSIEEIGTRSDLLERSLIIDLPNIDEKKRKSEKQFWRDFEKARPQILGAVLDVVSGAIRRLPEIEKKPDNDLPRLADFHMWGEAAEESLGLKRGTFSEAYASNRESASFVALESSPVIAALIAYLKKKSSIEATATELLEKINFYDPDYGKGRSWPKSARVLAQILRRVAPNLRRVGIIAEQDYRGSGNNKEKIWRITSPYDPAPSKKKEAGRKNRKGSKLAKKISKKKKIVKKRSRDAQDT